MSLVREVRRSLLVGYGMFRMHLTSYLSSTLNALLWLTLFLAPSVVFSSDPLSALLYLTPPVIGVNIVLLSIGLSQEYVTWLSEGGELDDLRLANLTLWKYVAATFPFDFLVVGFAPFLLSALLLSWYLGIAPTWLFRLNAALFALSIPVLMASGLLMASLIGLLYLKNPLARAVSQVIQILFVVVLFLPPRYLPEQYMALLVPGLVAVELLRASFGSNTISTNLLVSMTVPAVISYLLLSLLASRLVEKHFLKFGVETRY